MAFCTNCGSKVPEGVRFCSNCGTAVEVNNKLQANSMPVTHSSMENASYEHSSSRDLLRESSKKTWVDKLSKFFGIILMILAFVDFQSDPPVFTIILSLAIIAAAIFCLSQRYRLKGFTIIALILAIYCLIAGINQGKELGFFKIPSDSDYKSSSTDAIVDEIPKAEQETKKEAIVDETPKAEQETKKEAIVDETPKAEQETKEAPIVAEKSDEEDGVDPDLKAFLDSYEEFVDEYVTFMKKYMADPSNAISMLSEYTKIMGKYEEFADKVENYDSKTMSTADAKYYLEVTNRCTQKMLDIY